ERGGGAPWRACRRSRSVRPRQARTPRRPRRSPWRPVARRVLHRRARLRSRSHQTSCRSKPFSSAPSVCFCDVADMAAACAVSGGGGVGGGARGRGAPPPRQLAPPAGRGGGAGGGGGGWG